MKFLGHKNHVQNVLKESQNLSQVINFYEVHQDKREIVYEMVAIWKITNTLNKFFKTLDTTFKALDTISRALDTTFKAISGMVRRMRQDGKTLGHGIFWLRLGRFHCGTVEQLSSQGAFTWLLPMLHPWLAS